MVRAIRCDVSKITVRFSFRTRFFALARLSGVIWSPCDPRPRTVFGRFILVLTKSLNLISQATQPIDQQPSPGDPPLWKPWKNLKTFSHRSHSGYRSDIINCLKPSIRKLRTIHSYWELWKTLRRKHSEFPTVPKILRCHQSPRTLSPISPNHTAPTRERGAVKKSPPILGGVEARKSFGGGKGRLQTQDGQALPRSTTP
jgi:hypothetical protein